jgi:cellobiose phosphorylase
MRKFRGANYRIRISNPDCVNKGVRSIIVDGVPVSGCLIDAIAAGRDCDVEVVMGSAKRRQTA